MESNRKQWKMWIQFTHSCGLCSQIPSRSFVFLGAWIRRKSDTELTLTDLTDHGINLQGIWWHIFPDLVIQNSVLPVPFEKGELRSKGGGKKSIHFDGGNENIELLLRTVISANQLSICGTVADFCNEAPKECQGSGEIFCTWSFGKDGNFYGPLNCRKLNHCTATEKPFCKNTSVNSNSCQKTRNCSNCVLVMLVWSLSKKDNSSLLLIQKDNRCNIYAENIRCLAMKKGLDLEDGFSRIRGSAQSWTKMFATMMIETVSKFWYHLCFKSIPFLG